MNSEACGYFKSGKSGGSQGVISLDKLGSRIGLTSVTAATRIKTCLKSLIVDPMQHCLHLSRPQIRILSSSKADAIVPILAYLSLPETVVR